MKTLRSDPLETAVAQHVAAVLSIPVGGTLRHFKVRLMTLDEESLLIETAADQDLLLQQIVDCKTTVGMTFRLEQTKFIFATTAVDLQRTRTPLQAPSIHLRLRRPAALKTVQRRVGYRASVSPAADCTVRAWKIPEEQRLEKKVGSTHEIPLSIRDISEGGLGFCVAQHDGKPYELAVNQRLRVTVKFEGQELVVEGRVRHYKTLSDMSLVVGVQFVQSAEDPAARQAVAGMQRIVSHLVRHEARWKKVAG
ncbi:MAG: PilZ domain-containing protein [Tepidisphaeraceae bacterium]|jgi:c-di-GMP-binding flagellar brake protein YcgR